MFLTSMTILGGDLRQCYLAEYMHNLGHDVICFGTVPFPFSHGDGIPISRQLPYALSQARLVLGPVPFSKDGVHLNAGGKDPLFFHDLIDALRPGQILVGGGFQKEFVASCAAAQIPVWDLMKEEGFIRKNAALTGEGFLSYLIANTPFSLKNRSLLFLGYGRCAQEIEKLLTGFSMNIYVYDCKEEILALGKSQGHTPVTPGELLGYLPKLDLIVNTVCGPVLNDDALSLLSPDCILFDIASAPYGFREETAAQKNLRLFRCPGIPGRVMPQTAGEALGAAISERMLSYGL